MRQLIPIPLIPTDFDPEASFPQDVDRLIAAAATGGYEVSRHDATLIWRRYSEEVCASWLSLPDNDSDILPILLENATTIDSPSPKVSPPEGYTSWLDYAVACVDTRSVELECLMRGDKYVPSRQEMQDATCAELEALRRKAKQ